MKKNKILTYLMIVSVMVGCNDWYGVYSSGGVTNPKGVTSGSDRVIRGGSWFDAGNSDRVSGRLHENPSYRNINIGLRLTFSSY